MKLRVFFTTLLTAALLTATLLLATSCGATADLGLLIPQAPGQESAPGIAGGERCTVIYIVNGSATQETVPVGDTLKMTPFLPDGMVWRDQQGDLVYPAALRVESDLILSAQSFPRLRRDHDKFIDGYDDGLFHPEESMTRAQAAWILYGLLEDAPEGSAVYPDVPLDAWYIEATRCLGSLGILPTEGDGTFQPDRPLTRADLACMLEVFLPHNAGVLSYSDVPAGHPAYQAIADATGCGLFTGYLDGTFRPDGVVTRVEAAVVYDRLLGRTADTAALAAATDLRIFPDVPTTYWAYGPVMEASTSHGYTPAADGSEQWGQITAERNGLADGPVRVNGRLYWVQSGRFLYSTTTADGFTFDANGRYTTGSATLDETLNSLVEQYTDDSMTRDQKLRALYNYCRDSFTYLKRDYISSGQVGWEPAYAEQFLKTGKGNCYSFSATFCLLARELGQPAVTVPGSLGSKRSPHCWVEISLDGATYMFDPQLEWRYLHDYGRTGYNLFKMTPGKTPFIYNWPS